MSLNRSDKSDYDPLSSPHTGDRGEERRGERPSLSGPKGSRPKGPGEEREPNRTLFNPAGRKSSARSAPPPPSESGPETVTETPDEGDGSYAERLRQSKREARAVRDLELLSAENWVVRNGHYLTYVGLFCFSLLVFFRPYELVPGLGFLAATAFYAAAATLLFYLPTQLATEGNLTTLSTEVKCILVIAGLALLLMPLARSPAMAWEVFNDSFSKAVVMFVVMVNVLRTRRRLLGIIWISLGAGFVLSYMALSMYLRGEISVEGYRVAVNIGGMFGNPNELALHLVMMTPIAFCLGLAAKNIFLRYLYFVTAGLFVAATTVTYSRGGFLGLLAFAGILIWKLGRKRHRGRILATAGVCVLLFVLLAPGDYGSRISSIFNPSLDAVGSVDQRTALLRRSLLVTARNPWGIGLGNFSIVGFHHLGTHNTYTQISAELGIVSLGAYLIFLISPLRRLGAIERRLLDRGETRWFYYLAVGLQASIVGFMVSSFFAAVAYNWFVYYLIAYAVAFRRIYLIEQGLGEEDIRPESLRENLLARQKG